MTQSHHNAETFEFQAEVRHLLDIVVHSLYANKDVFVRELISNASDALEKLRHLQLTEKDIHDRDLPLEINITTDNSAKAITIEDSGVGMTHAELVQNLGTIAHSGSKAFLNILGEGAQADVRLIGRFGLGFYSAFMAAKTVKVYSRSWRGDHGGSVWTSDGLGTFDVTTAADVRRGTKVAIELKDDDADYSHEWKIREILERYSAFVPFPINLNGTRVNTIQALWLRGKNEVTNEAYAEFYRFHAHAADDPRLRLHFRADAPLAINALLFVPSQNAEKLSLGRTEPSVALYSRRVLIDARPPDLLPSWLRFVTGVVDSDDLPLNVSRETFQDKTLIGKLGKVITGRFLRFLEEEADQRPESYAAFYNEFGQFLREGASLDFSHREQLAKLLRFESSATTSDKRTSLPEYVPRMKPGQTDIYYLIGSSRSAIERGPYIEGFKARDLEVLYCFEPVDEYVMSGIVSFDGKRIVAADHADVQLAAAPTASDALSEDDAATLIAWLRDTLGDRVATIKASDRLLDSPVIAISADRFTLPHRRRMMRAMNRTDGGSPMRINLEINSRHTVIKRLLETRTTDPPTATLVAEQLLDNALLSAGLLDDHTTMVARLNSLLARVQGGLMA